MIEYHTTTITKAVIPCGGLGTRFLPITKAVPKEILPIIDTPVLGYIISEAIDSGITDILIVLGKGKEAIAKYFEKDIDLIKKLRDNGKEKEAKLLEKIGEGAKIVFETQKQPRGSGDALLYGEKFTKGEPFCLAWGDDLIVSERPVMGQLIKAYEAIKKPILGVQKILGDNIVNYGVADTGDRELDPITRTVKADGILEKPKLKDVPKSRLAALGRYVLEADIFDIIKNQKVAEDGELQVTCGLATLAKQGRLYAYDFIGRRYDMGSKLGAAVATVEFALKDKEFGGEFRKILKDTSI